ncbi:MAG: hypothetical protein U0527_07870 [Candidatus Eisenbacteria bacterium]
MIPRRTLGIAALSLLLVLSGAEAWGSAADLDARLAKRLDPPLLTEVRAIVASAQAESLPEEPLVLRSLEGAAKGASPPQILEALRVLLGHLRVARAALGQDAAVDALRAGADALAAGVDSTTVAGFAPGAASRATVVGLVVLSDLVTRGVPAPLAAHGLRAMIAAGTAELEFLDLRSAVERDIAKGTAPSRAMEKRIESMMRDLPLERR